VVGTPIGNLEDLSVRALSTLRGAALVACEDTRVTRAILARHDLDVPLLSCHRFNERVRARRILEVLGAGGDVALLSDSGTPGVSDPGAAVVEAARGARVRRAPPAGAGAPAGRAAGFRIAPVPGPTAAAALFSVSGLQGSFTFVGFLPARAGERRRALEGLRSEPRSLVLYESPHRIVRMLRDAAEILGERVAILGRELTKVHEEVQHGTLQDLAAAVEQREPRGEFTLVIAAPAPAARAPGQDAEGDLEAAVEEVRARVLRGEDRREALRHAARAHGVRRRALYARLLGKESAHGDAGHNEEE
jgi:16S rRNA (cytidine1402-2'-O)-methyltransferase